MYERVQKNRSSWSPDFKPDYTESLFRPRPFSIQAQPDTESSEEQEIPAYSRAERDSISAKLLKTMGANVQSQTEAEAPKPHSEPEGLESDEISDEGETLQRRGEKDEMPISLTTPVADNSTQLQAIALAPAAGAAAAVFGPVGLAVVIGVTGVTIIVCLNNGGWEEIGRITDVIGKGIENTLQELRNILNRAGDAAKAQLRRIEDYIRPVRNIIRAQKNGRTVFSPSTKMKNPFHYIQQYPKRTKQLLGISHEQFQQLLVQAEARHKQQQAAKEKNKVRLNAKGGGCKPKLSLSEEVCLCLFYLRQLPTFKEENKVLSSKRIFVEHVIRLLKIFRIARERFRLHPDTYEQVILTVCGLVRLRIGTVVLPVPEQL